MTPSLALGTLGWSARHSDAELSALLRMAEAGGMDAVDTANAYERGATEARLRSLGTTLPVWTKAGIARVEGRAEGLSPSALRAAVEQSLDRLGRKSLERVLLHAPDAQTPLEQTLDALCTLMADGKIRAWGLSNYPAWRVAEALGLARMRGLPPPADVQVLYHPLAREAELEIFPMCVALGLSASVYNPLAGGRLARTSPNPQGRLATNSFYRKRYGAERLLERAIALEWVAQDFGMSLAEASFRWSLSQTAIRTVVVGPRTVEQLAELLQWHARGPLPAEAMETMRTHLDSWRGMTETYIRGD